MDSIENNSPQFEKEQSAETKEVKLSPEAAAAAQMERADQLVKEVKSSKNQMANIVMHMGQVQKAIKQIRQQLQLAASDDPASSVEHDQEVVDKLKKQIEDHKEELLNMKDDLIRTQTQEVLNAQPQLGKEDATLQAKKQVEQMLQS